jgi:hypothetical protein
MRANIDEFSTCQGTYFLDRQGAMGRAYWWIDTRPSQQFV